MMDKKTVQATSVAEEQEAPSPTSSGERVWQEPKLTFIEPKLVSHGKLEQVTGFFGPITP